MYKQIISSNFFQKRQKACFKKSPHTTPIKNNPDAKLFNQFYLRKNMINFVYCPFLFNAYEKLRIPAHFGGIE